MKKLIAIVLLVSAIHPIGYAQTTVSLDNYTGTWENNASWVGGAAPPADIVISHLNLIIDGYITRTGNINIGVGTETGDFIVNDTLVIVGDLNLAHNAAELVIGPNAVLIVIGNVTTDGNNQRITNNGIFVVSVDMTFPTNGSETYDQSGGGELFVMGDAENNPTASGSDNSDQLDDIYPAIYDFVMCGGSPSCTLPITLSYFHVDLQIDIVELRWATVMEEAFRKFIVQRSSNGIDFEDIGEVAGKGFNIYDIESKYGFDDRYPLTGFNYYRLKAIDLDDSYEYFGVRAVKVTAPKKMDVYPNPSTGNFIAFQTNFNPAESDRIMLIDQLGIEVFNSPASVAQSGFSPESKLQPGIYLLRYVSNDFEQTTRVMVRN